MPKPKGAGPQKWSGSFFDLKHHAKMELFAYKKSGREDMIRSPLLATVGLTICTPALAATEAILVVNLVPDAATGATGPAQPC